MTGVDVGGRVIVLHDLEAQIETAGIPIPYGLSIVGPPLATPPLPSVVSPAPCPDGSLLFTYDAQGNPVDLPSEALSIIAEYQA